MHKFGSIRCLVQSKLFGNPEQFLLMLLKLLKYWAMLLSIHGKLTFVALANSLLRRDALWEDSPSVAAMAMLMNSQIGMELRNEDLGYSCILSFSPLT